jgi:hypothetical protein
METETESFSYGINVNIDTGVRFEPEPSSSKAVNVSTSLNSAFISLGKKLNRLPIRRTLVISRVYLWMSIYKGLLWKMDIADLKTLSKRHGWYIFF